MAADLTQIPALDHQPGHPDLLLHPAHHHRLVHRLVGPADKIAVKVQIHVIDALHGREGLVDKDIVHIEGVLGQLQPTVPQQLGAVDHRVHQKVLGGTEPAHLIPGKDPILGKDIAVAHDLSGVVLHMLVDIVGDEQIQRLGPPGGLPQLVQHHLKGLGVQPVIGVHHFVV